MLFAFFLTLVSLPPALPVDYIPGDGGYAQFQLSERDNARMTSQAYLDCMARSHDLPAKMRRCSAAEYRRIDAQLNRQYKMTLRQMPSARAKQQLRQYERIWMLTRWQNCSKGLVPESSPQHEARALGYDRCVIEEQMRRTVWLERYR